VTGFVECASPRWALADESLAAVALAPGTDDAATPRGNGIAAPDRGAADAMAQRVAARRTNALARSPPGRRLLVVDESHRIKRFREPADDRLGRAVATSATT
jgi:hypothetical protein